MYQPPFRERRKSLEGGRPWALPFKGSVLWAILHNLTKHHFWRQFVHIHITLRALQGWFHDSLMCMSWNSLWKSDLVVIYEVCSSSSNLVCSSVYRNELSLSFFQQYIRRDSTHPFQLFFFAVWRQSRPSEKLTVRNYKTSQILTCK